MKDIKTFIQEYLKLFEEINRDLFALNIELLDNTRRLLIKIIEKLKL